MRAAFLVVAVLFAILDCAGGQGPTLAEAKAAFARHDRKLNIVYSALKKELEADRFALVQEDQRQWLEYRDYVAEWQSQARQKDPREDVGYWEMAAGMTEERVDYLRAWRGIGEPGSWAGRYSDGRGGLLEIVEAEHGFYFSLLVVRGPTSHIGDIAGKAEVNGFMARFSVKDEGMERPCWISFLNNRNGDGRIEVFTANADRYHGMRAYFDATYLRVGLLDAKARAEVIAAANEGGARY